MDDTCTWTHIVDIDGDRWDTSCKQVFAFTDGDIADNDFRFCPYCGRRIVEVTP